MRILHGLLDGLDDGTAAIGFFEDTAPMVRGLAGNDFGDAIARRGGIARVVAQGLLKADYLTELPPEFRLDGRRGDEAAGTGRRLACQAHEGAALSPNRGGRPGDPACPVPDRAAGCRTPGAGAGALGPASLRRLAPRPDRLTPAATATPSLPPHPRPCAGDGTALPGGRRADTHPARRRRKDSRHANPPVTGPPAAPKMEKPAAKSAPSGRKPPPRSGSQPFDDGLWAAGLIVRGRRIC